MRRRRTRNHSDSPSFLGGIFTLVAKLLLLLVIMTAAAELVSGFVLERLRSASPASLSSLRDEDLIRLYDTATPQLYRDVLDEQSHLIQTTYAPLLEYRMTAVQGKSYTITAQGFRSNGQPQDLQAAGAKVFVFGGSSVLGRGVPDQETLSAQLGDVLAAAGKSAQVFNFGAQDYVIEQERLFLESLLLAGHRPDVAVFVDGLHDFYSCRLPARTAWSDRLEEASNKAFRRTVKGAGNFQPHVVQLYNWFFGTRPAAARDWGAACDNDQAVQAMIDRVQANRRLIQGLAERYNVKTVFVQQPVPAYHYDNMRRPIRLNSDGLGHYINAGRAYARMAELRESGALVDPAPLWLADLEPGEGNAYVDAIHYSPRFNRAIADAIGRHLLESALLP